MHMNLTILGSGGCTVIPKPLCSCNVCREARRKGPPYERTGPCAYISDSNLLIDTPAEVATQLNRGLIDTIDFLTFTHLDPDHVEGFRVVEQIALDFRTWEAYPDKQIQLILPELLMERIRDIRSVYGPLVEFYEKQGFIKSISYKKSIKIKQLLVSAIPVECGDQTVYIYIFEKEGRKIVYAPCDIKPFPEEEKEVQGADLVVIQPGIFEDGLKHNFKYPDNHISRKTLYTFEDTIALCKRIRAGKVLFVHLEEYWNRSYDDYFTMQSEYENIRFAWDGMCLTI